MIDFTQMQVTYTPGSGYTGTIPDSKVTLRWGDEFVTQVREEIAKKAERLVQEAANPQPRKELSAEDISALAAKYDPTKMSQKEYDAFLDELVDKEVLKREELGQLGYHGLVDVTFDSGCYAVDSSSLLSSPYGRYGTYGLSYGLSDTDGNALALSRLAALWQPAAGSDAFFAAAGRRISAFDAMGSILEAMQEQR